MVTPDQIERLAILAYAAYVSPSAPDHLPALDWSDLSETTKSRFRAAVRAVIAGYLREVTD